MSWSGRGVRQDALTGLAALIAVLWGATACRQSTPAWSPDGSTIVFAYELAEGLTALAVCDLASGELRTLFEDGEHPIRGEPTFLRPIFDPDGERIVVLAGRAGLVPAFEILSLAPDGEILQRKVFEPELCNGLGAAGANLLPVVTSGSSVWFAWRVPGDTLELAYRRFDLDRNELTDDVLPPGLVLLPGGGDPYYIEPQDDEDPMLGRIDLASRERTPIARVAFGASEPAGLSLCSVGEREAALLSERGASGHERVELRLVELESGAQRSVELGELGACGDFVLGPRDRELFVLAAKEGGLWLHRVCVADGGASSVRLFGPAPGTPLVDELLVLDAGLSVSPDGRWLAVSAFASAHSVGQPDLYVYELGDELRTVGRFHAPR